MTNDYALEGATSDFFQQEPKLMTDNWLYPYPPLVEGRLLKRYKRFFADIELTTGDVITAHCPNTGPMTGVCTAGSLVQVSRSDNPNRKLAYTWEMIQVLDNGPTWVGVNTALPNRVIKAALEQQIFLELRGKYREVRPEFPYGKDKKSRVDFLLNGPEQLPIYLEVKNVTLIQGAIALFPDTVTTRGQKHLQELMALLPEARPVMLYFINRGDCAEFAPGDGYDPLYGQLLREAIARGVTVLPYRFEITPQCLRFLGLAPLLPHQPPLAS